MRVDVSMEPENKFHASSWWAETPQFVVETLQKQLEAAQAMWPELKLYAVAKKRERKRSPLTGGQQEGAT